MGEARFPSGLKPVSELAKDRPHGDRLRYMAGCRCADCRRANTEYEKSRAAARKAGNWNGLVPAQRARAHMAALSTASVGRRQVADASGVADSILFKIISGERLKIRALTERAILAVTPAAAADHALIDAAPSWELLDDLLAVGFSKADLARELGMKTPALQINRSRVTVRNAHDVLLMHQRLRCVPFKATERLIRELREEGFRQDRIEAMATERAALRGLAAPDFRVRNGYVNANTAALVLSLHEELTREPA